MKSLLKMIAVGTVLTATMMAQRPFGLRSASTADPATVVAHKVDRLTKMLSLNATQATQATTIFSNSLNSVTPLETNLRTARQSLQNAVKTNDVAAIETLSTNIGTLTGQVMAVQNKADAAFYAILDASQQQTLNQRRDFGHGFGRMRGGPAAPAH